MSLMIDNALLNQIKELPHKSGVYLFKDLNRQIIYVGKAKDLRNRVIQYVQRFDEDVKSSSILTTAISVECIETGSELEALMLEAQLIQSHQPRFNVLLKEGQPFLYIMITQASEKGLPTLELVRHKRKQGLYFGPFLEKNHARAVYDFLMKTFRLKMCGKKIPGGCLYFHLGTCSGSCKDDFDEAGYRDRLGLAQLVLQKGRKKFFEFLQNEIASANKKLAFERSRELYNYLQSFDRIFDALSSKPAASSGSYVKKDIWFLSPDKRELYFFEERDGILKKREHFYFYPQEDQEAFVDLLKEYFLSVYRQRRPAHVILSNVDFGQDQQLFQNFLQQLHDLELTPAIHTVHDGHYAQLMKMAEIHVAQDREKRHTLGLTLKRLFGLPSEPKTIDCFDISHKQGTFVVGACIRFFNGDPQPEKFRKFKIKTVIGQNDYACLREVVERRYRGGVDLPDLILIDGGKGQLHAVDDLFPGAEFASLAKREETIFSKRLEEGKKLDLHSFSGQVLVALRDYTHHFAISYHRLLASKIEVLDQ